MGCGQEIRKENDQIVPNSTTEEVSSNAASKPSCTRKNVTIKELAGTLYDLSVNCAPAQRRPACG